MKVVIVIPAHNEEAVIENSVVKMNNAFFSFWNKDDWKIIIAENGSTDFTFAKAAKLSSVLPNVSATSTPFAGKGEAIRRAWEMNPADVYMFFDADLSADPEVAKICVERILSGADVVAPSRFNCGSKIKRKCLRKIISWGYRLLLFLFFSPPVSDLPCGVKAVSPDIVRRILPKIKNDGFFFDSELILRADREGFRIIEVPVVWNDAKKIGRLSHVPLWRTARSYIKSMLELKKEFKKSAGSAD